MPDEEDKAKQGNILLFWQPIRTANAEGLSEVVSKPSFRVVAPISGQIYQSKDPANFFEKMFNLWPATELDYTMIQTTHSKIVSPCKGTVRFTRRSMVITSFPAGMTVYVSVSDPDNINSNKGWTSMVPINHPVVTGQGIVRVHLEPGEQAAVFIAVDAELGVAKRMMEDYEEVLAGKKVLWEVKG